MLAIRTIASLVTLLLACLSFGPLLILGGWLGLRRSTMDWVPRAWSRFVLWGARVRVVTEGLEHIPTDTTPVFVANHQSALDIPVLGAVLPPGTLWLGKRELFSVPLFGRAIRVLGCIPVDRSDREGARASIGDAVGEVRAGSPVIIFPEGTRSTGDTLGAFKLGFIHLTGESGAPAVPVLVSGASSLLAKRSFRVRSGTVRVRFLPPVTIPAGLDSAGRHARAAAVRSSMALALEEGRG